jgi:acyl-CoA oxidase
MDMRGTAQATARMIGGTFLERTTARAVIDRILAGSKSKDVGSRAWHIEMFEDREKHTVEGLAKRMRAAAKASDSFAAVNACQQHMLAAARAHTDRVVLEAFIEGIHQCEDRYIASILGKVCDLYALATIEENRGWYMEHERFDGARSKAITEAVDALCVELRGKALELVEGLGVEEAWLNAAILR